MSDIDEHTHVPYPVPCGFCGRKPGAWDWHPRGARLVCACGVSGPAEHGAATYEDCIPAWNRMWETKPGPNTRRLVDRMAAGLAADIHSLESEEDKEAAVLVLMALAECGGEAAE